MAKEYTSVGNEYGIPTELSEPTEHINPAPDIGATAQEYITPPQYGESSANKIVKAKSNKLYKNFLRKVVYGLSSAVMVVTLATSASTNEYKPPAYSEKDIILPTVEGLPSANDENIVKDSQTDADKEKAGLLVINPNHSGDLERPDSWYYFDLLADGTIYCEKEIEEPEYRQSFKDVLKGISFDYSSGTIYFDNYKSNLENDPGSRDVEIYWWAHEKPLTIDFNSSNHFSSLTVESDNISIVGAADVNLRYLTFSRHSYSNTNRESFDSQNYNRRPTINVSSETKFIGTEDFYWRDYYLNIRYIGTEPVSVEVLRTGMNVRASAHTSANGYTSVEIQMRGEQLDDIISNLE